jgi:hypothetical protein
MGINTLNYSGADGAHSVDLDRDSASIGCSPNQDIVLAIRALPSSRRDCERATLKSGDVLQMGFAPRSAATLSP